jgi:hypothetical protein
MAMTKAAVPKRIGGVKLSKPLRQNLKALSRSEAGRARIAEALAGVDAVLASGKPRAPAARKPAAAPKSAAKSAKPARAAKVKRPALASGLSEVAKAPAIVAPASGGADS